MSMLNAQTMTFTDGENGVTLGDDYLYFIPLADMTIIGVCAAPSVDDASAAIDIEDDGTAVIEDVGCSDQNVPGTWKSTAIGGTNAPVVISAGSLVSLTATDMAANTRAMVQITYLFGSVGS